MTPFLKRSISRGLLHALAAFAPFTGFGGIDARMLRQPDVSATQITFVYAGDVWVVPREGGSAHRLSSPAGEESFPRFSPDGSLIAFTGDYDGNEDVYVVPSSGGSIRRLTFHPVADRVLDWNADGAGVLFASTRESETGKYSQFFRVPLGGGLPVRLPIPYGEFAAVAPDGDWVAYTPRSVISRTWKRYRGGTAADIWLFNLRTFEARNLTDSPAGDEVPMWHGRRLYFLSDRGPEQRYNLWVHDLDDHSTRALTRFTDFDISSAAIGPGDIVFEAGGRLHLYGLTSGQEHAVDIEVVTDLATLRPRSENAADLLRGATVSPTGKRIIVEARGDLFSIPAEHGPVLNLTRTSGAAELFPAWSPDGKSVAYVTDGPGEYQVAIRPADGSGEETVLTTFGEGFRYQAYWSPDSRKLAFVDQAMNVQIRDLDRKQTTVVDQLRWLYHNELLDVRLAWSPDSRWLAYDKLLENRNPAVFLFDVDSGERHQVTSGGYQDSSPVFDPAGKYLFLLTSRHLDPDYDDLQNTWIYANTVQIAALPLRRDVASPLKPRNDEEPAEGSSKTDGKDKSAAPKDGEDGKSSETKTDADSSKSADKDKEPARKAKESEPVEIHFADLERRLVVLPPRPGLYADLTAVDGRLVYRRLPNKGAADRDSTLLIYDLKEREEKAVLEKVDSVEVTRDGKKALVRRGKQWAIVELKPSQKFEKPLATGSLPMMVNPAEEWRQIFNDAWRFNRDFFYDPNHHGLDWNAVRARYAALLKDAVTRWDVNFVIGEMIGELNSSHTYRGGGDVEEGPSRPVGLLGADLALEQSGYRIVRILRGATWDSEVRSVFDEPGLNVREGDFLLAVNGVELRPDRSPWAALEGLADQVVRLTVHTRPTLDGATNVLVKALTLSQERRLRHLAWVEANRRHVDEATDGAVGYIYVPDTSTLGQTELFRQFRAQFDRQGLIIDERFNSGGQLGDRFLELLGRRPFTYLAFRHGPDMPWPPVGHFGPQVMLINGWSGSGGDAFPWFFRTARRGPIVGQRTWGGLIGPAMGHQLIDGGVVVVPPGRLFGPDGKWFAEGHGVDPDIPVPEDPTGLARGTDSQLERAIQEVRRLIQEHPPVELRRPAYEYRGWPK